MLRSLSVATGNGQGCDVVGGDGEAWWIGGGTADGHNVAGGERGCWPVKESMANQPSDD